MGIWPPPKIRFADDAILNQLQSLNFVDIIDSLYIILHFLMLPCHIVDAGVVVDTSRLWETVREKEGLDMIPVSIPLSRMDRKYVGRC